MWRLKVHFELKLPIYLGFMVALAIIKPFTYLKNTLHEFIGPLISGLWPEIAINLDILTIHGGSRSILSSNYLLVFMVALAIMKPLTYLKNILHEFFGPLWPDNALNFDI